MTTPQIISIVVFVAVMALVMSEKRHRAIAAIAGAVILLLTGTITFDVGIAAVDFNTIGVLIGMMLYVAVVKPCGLFEFIAVKAARLAKGNPWRIMVFFIIITALLSAMLDNVTTVLLMGPMTLMVCRTLKVNPVPFFLTEIMASNIGGTSTLIGDPPNIMIGSQAGLTFMDFIKVNGPIIVIIIIAIIIIFKFMFGRKMHVTQETMAEIMELNPKDYINDYRMFRISIAMIIAVTIGFAFHDKLGLQSSIIALTAAAIMLLISSQDFEHTIRDVEWSTIVFFIFLFMVVGAMEHQGVIEMFANWIVDITHGNVVLTMIVILWVSAIASAFLDNIPFVATMIPIIFGIQAAGVDVTPLWWALSLGACLGGNGTIIGASANVVLCSISERQGHPITFMYFMKVCFPVMIVTILLSMVYLLVIF
ncbi:MAG: SLC13 family permease [Coriobacteriales bacterium]